MRRDVLLLIVLGILLVLGFALPPIFGLGQGQGADYTSYSTGPQGANALYQWVGELGYQTERIGNTPSFVIDSKAQALFEIAPSGQFSPGDLQVLSDWVESGHTLVLALPGSALPIFGQDDPSQDVANQFDLGVLDAGALITQTSLVQPLSQPFAAHEVNLETLTIVGERPEGYVAYTPLDSDGAAGVVTFSEGQGRVFVLSGAFPLLNNGIADDDNRELALDVLSSVPLGGEVAFDEYHHGYVAPTSASSLFYETPWGWALWYGVLIGIVFLLLDGRRFGPALARVQVAGRSTAEYVESMASLYRRAQYRAPIVAHLATRFRRTLVNRLLLNPRLSDADLARAAAEKSGVDAGRVAALLQPPGNVVDHERDMVRLALEMGRVTEEVSRKKTA